MTKPQAHLSIIHQSQVTISLLLYGGRVTVGHSDSKTSRSILDEAAGETKQQRQISCESLKAGKHNLWLMFSTCGTEEEGFWLSQVLEDFISDRNLSVCK